jgi:sugar (pentulose or hexulose) kinase
MNTSLYRRFSRAPWQAFAMTLVLTIDWSHASTAVTIVDIEARTTVAEAHGRHAASATTFDSATIWWDALVEAARTAIDGLAVLNLTTDDIRLVELSRNEPSGGLVGFDHAGAVCAALSSSHTESSDDAKSLLSLFEGGADAWRSLTGVLPTAGSTISLLSWLRRNSPEAWERLHTFTLPIGYLATRLGGESSLSISAAMGTAFVDRQTTSWCTSLLELVDAKRDWPVALPPITSAATPIGMLSVDAARTLGLPEGRPLHLGETTRR